jgi:GDP-L-fucose synthase
MEQNAKIYIAGYKGLVGSAILNKLEKAKFSNIITCSKQSLDLRNQWATQGFFDTERPNYVFIAAAKVGGIYQFPLSG